MSNVTIQKRGNFYQYKFEIAKVDGKRKFLSKSGFKTKSEAEKEGVIAYNDYLNTGNSFSASDMSYSDFLDYWLENYCYINLKYHTIEGYSNIIKNHIKPNIGYFRLSQIARSTLQEFINKISGTTGIMGSSDTTFILEKKSRDNSVATLFVTGRDVEYQTFTLRFEECRWNLIERSFQKELEMKNAPEIIYKVISFINNNGKWQGSATELLNVLDEKDITPQYLTKVLNEYSKTILSDNQISFATSRTSSSRLVTLEKDIVEASEETTEAVSISNDNDYNDDDDNKSM